jgi:hypothetical protein
MRGEDLVRDWFSVSEVVETLDQSRPADSGNHSRDNDGSDSWDLNLGYRGALDAYSGGWAEGAQKAYELADRLTPKPIGNRTTLQRSVAGSFPNVGAYLAGAPDSMYRVSKKAATSRPYVHLYLPIMYNAGVTADTAFNRGCAMVALCDALETAGCRVKITLVLASQVNGGNRCVMRLLVKDYQDRLDVDQLIFTAAHPAFFRRLCFALYERSEYEPVRAATRGGYGSSTNVLARDCPKDGGNAVTVLLPRLDHDSRQSPETFLSELVASLPEEVRTEIGE